MVYELIGRAVVKAAKHYLRRRYGPTMVPKPLLAVVVIGAVAGLAALSSRRDDG